MDTIRLVVSTTSGKLVEVNEFQPAGMALVKPISPSLNSYIPLPEDAHIQTLQGRVPMAFDPDLQKSIRLHEYAGERIQPIAAILPPGYLQQYRPAYTAELDAQRLSPASYSLLGKTDSGFVVAAISPQQEESIVRVSEVDQKEEIAQKVRSVKDNTNSRLYFALSSEKGIDTATMLASKLEPKRLILSGRADLLAANPSALQLFGSVFTEVNSFQDEFYSRFQPSDSMPLDEALDFSTNLSNPKSGICYQVFPGLTDHPLEIAAMKNTLQKLGDVAIKLLNLPCDPEWYIEELALLRQHRQMIGMSEWLKEYRHIMSSR